MASARQAGAADQAGRHGEACLLYQRAADALAEARRTNDDPRLSEYITNYTNRVEELQLEMAKTASTQTAAPDPSPSNSVGAVDPGALNQLLAMGLPRERSMQALRMYDNNVDLALNWVLNNAP